MISALLFVMAFILGFLLCAKVSKKILTTERQKIHTAWSKLKGLKTFEKIDMQVIPHNKHRFITIGDYWIEGLTLKFRVSDMQDPRYHMLVLLHELIEFILTQERGIAEEDITAFDVQYEKEREQGLHTPEDEPGDDPYAPYRKEHIFATKIEKMLAEELGVDWAAYDAAMMKLL